VHKSSLALSNSKRFEWLPESAAAMNLKSLAETLGLSQTTVSRALAGYADVAEPTRLRVVSEARRLGYTPNAAAQRLAMGKARAIGIVFATSGSVPADPLFMEFLTGLATRAAERQTDILISSAMTETAEDLRVYRRLAEARSVDAVVVTSPLVEDPRAPLISRLRLPMVLHGRTRASAPYAHVDIDNEGAFYRATKLLLDLGHKRIALINGEERFNFAVDRQRGVTSAFADRGLAPLPQHLTFAAMTDERGYRLTRQLMESDLPPTAILCSSLLSALGCCRALRDLGLKVGEHVSVIAHDDAINAIKPETLSPPLTTTSSPIRAHGVRIAEVALAMIDGADPADFQEVWPVDLIVRGSTQPPPG
jgi:LacI family transcriptional regulator